MARILISIVSKKYFEKNVMSMMAFEMTWNVLNVIIVLNVMKTYFYDEKWESPMFGPLAHDVAHSYVYCFYQECLIKFNC